ncbi:hypothetical protein ABK178_004943 [Salmonella enterica subsp. enterica serovar Brandenburg]
MIAAHAFPDTVYLLVCAPIAAVRQSAVSDFQYMAIKTQHSCLHQVLYMPVAQFRSQFPG